MEQYIVKSLDSTLECVEVQIDETRIIMEIESTCDVMECPYCGEKSGKIHSKYQRRIQDLPVQNKQVTLDSYISGLQNDIAAVKNGIDLQYNNGLA